MALQTVSHARNILADAGFVEDLVADDGQLRAVPSGRRYSPQELVVAQLLRFQGITAPQEEAILFALATRDGEPLGTYLPAYRPTIPAADLVVVKQLHERAIPPDEIRAHRRHDHIAAVFDDRQAAQAAVDELRQLGLGSDRLGVAVREGAPFASEQDAETELIHDTETGVVAGAVVGFLSGMSIAAVALVPGGLLGLGGILAISAATGLGGAMLGGYLGDYIAERAFNEREELSAVRLEPGQVLIAACSHGHPATVEAILEHHGGQLLLRPHP